MSNLHETNNDTYNRIKNLSFITAQSENIFSFDKTIQKILLDHLKETEQDFIYETRTAAIEFFHSAFYEVDAERNKNITDDDRENFFRFWYEIILRTTDGAEYLMKLFIEHLEPLISKFDDEVFENVIKQFQNKIKETDGTENIPFAYFEYRLAQIKIYQYKMNDAPELAKSAYRKFESLPLTDEQKIIKISVISTLADVYSKLENNAAEIEKREQAVKESEKIFSDKTDENIIDAKYKLAIAFRDADKNNRALEIYEEINFAQINVDLQKVPAEISKIAFTLTIDDTETQAQNFSQIKDACISVVDAQTNKEILYFDLQENFSIENAIIAGEIYRYKGAWKFNAIGAGFSGGLESLCKNFGVETD